MLDGRIGNAHLYIKIVYLLPYLLKFYVYKLNYAEINVRVKAKVDTKSPVRETYNQQQMWAVLPPACKFDEMRHKIR